jgi:hypothetical protein
MSTTIIERRLRVEPVAVNAWVENRIVHVSLYDDRVISFPAHKFTRLKAANDEALSKVRIRAQGSALRWDEIDEDVSVEGIVEGLFEED